MKRPVLVYDGDCGFCRLWVAAWRKRTGDSVGYVPARDAGDVAAIPRERLEESVWLIEPDGRSSRGAEAVFRALSHAPGQAWWLKAYERLPGFASASRLAYGFIARRRRLFSRITLLLWGPRTEPSTYNAARWLFLRALGAIYLCAFVSAWSQWEGLLGAGGILPAARYLEAARAQLGNRAFWALPTVLWLSPTDAALKALCMAGTALSALLILGLWPGASALLLWGCYLSICSAGQEFFSFQWDILLLETGFLAVLLAPAQSLPRPGRETAVPAGARWLCWWLLFRLMVQSGIVKLSSGDPAWRSLTALDYHYQTQPLPTWVGYYAHQLPAWFQKACAAVMFAIELAVPVLIWLGPRARLLAATGISLLMILILLTGNYCFFNLLVLALCLLLLDDSLLKGVLPRGLAGWLASFGERPLPLHRRLIGPPIGLAVVLVGSIQFWGLLAGGLDLPDIAARAYRAASAWRTVNHYGLFAVMTTSRPEIIVEGSLDGRIWREYAFRWKPGDPLSRPRYNIPHQPRLDWQMWFAALGSYQRNPWLIHFMARLLEGSPAVLGLLAADPFPDGPPRFVRAVVYEYRFTTPAQKREGRGWWTRELKGLYAPVLARR